MADSLYANVVIGEASLRNDPRGSAFAIALALAFYVAGCTLLVTTGPTFGTLHAFAAFIVLTAVGALNQLLPVLTHAPNAHAGTVSALALSFAVGFVFLIAGFYGAPTFAPASAILGTSAIVWVGWSIYRLTRGRSERRTRTLLALALVAFLTAVGIGAAMAGQLGGFGHTTSALSIAPVHAMLAIGGFAGILVLTISYRFVPMFAIAHAERYGHWEPAWGVALGVIVAAASLAGSTIGTRIGLAAIVVSLFVLGAQHLKTIASRLRARLDVSLQYGRVAWTFAIGAALTAFVATWIPGRVPSAIALALLGWLSITILGYAYKVVGFLTWQSAKARVPAARLPALGSAVDLPWAYVALALLTAGALAAAAFMPFAPQFARIGYDVYALGGITAVVAIARLAALYLFISEEEHGIETEHRAAR
ncbi:MAG: hypothetical protein ACP5O6_00905 [Candidatus Baltobacteraceae bacterium]